MINTLATEFSLSIPQISFASLQTPYLEGLSFDALKIIRFVYTISLSVLGALYGEADFLKYFTEWGLIGTILMSWLITLSYFIDPLPSEY